MSPPLVCIPTYSSLSRFVPNPPDIVQYVGNILLNDKLNNISNIFSGFVADIFMAEYLFANIRILITMHFSSQWNINNSNRGALNREEKHIYPYEDFCFRLSVYAFTLR